MNWYITLFHLSWILSLRQKPLLSLKKIKKTQRYMQVNMHIYFGFYNREEISVMQIQRDIRTLRSQIQSSYRQVCSCLFWNYNFMAMSCFRFCLYIILNSVVGFYFNLWNWDIGLGFLVYMFSSFPVLMFENRKRNESNAAIL